MSKAKELRDKFEKDLEELQNSCPHIETEIMPYMWAPGHYSGNVKVCKECEKILETIPGGFPEQIQSVA